MTYLPLIDYLPHRPPMVLLDRVIKADAAHMVCEVAIRVDSQFCNGAAVPAWVGIEYMAQTIGALAGWRSQAKQAPVKVGFLVGTRRYQTHVSQFQVGETLRITASEELSNPDGLVAMHCTIHDAHNTLLAEASLLVFQPDDLEAYLQQTANSRANDSALQ